MMSTSIEPIENRLLGMLPAVIEYRRGHITVLDRARLETLSCACYGVVKHETERLLPWTPRPKARPTPLAA